MIQTAIAAFVGAFGALVALENITGSNKVLRYLAALVVGAILTFVLALVLGWVAGIFARLHL